MRSPRLAAVTLVVLILGAPALAQDQSCEAAFEELEQEAEAAMEQANSTEERQQIRERYSEKFAELEERCAPQNRTAERPDTATRPADEGDRIEPRQAATMPAEKCREEASRIKQEFANAVADTGIMEMQGPIERFMRQRGRLAAQCSIFARPEVDGRGPPADVPPERPPMDRGERNETDERGQPEDIELSYELPERTPERCRAKIGELRKEYETKIAENPDRSKQLRQEFYTTVEKRLESCRGRPRLVNVSEAPEMMSASCTEQMRELNREITANTDAQVGDRVPEQYLDRYKQQIKECMQGAVAERVKEGIADRIGEAAGGIIGQNGGPDADTSLQQELAEKEQTIERLRDRIDELEQRLADATGGEPADGDTGGDDAEPARESGGEDAAAQEGGSDGSAPQPDDAGEPAPSRDERQGEDAAPESGDDGSADAGTSSGSGEPGTSPGEEESGADDESAGQDAGGNGIVGTIASLLG
ncbi:MAG: hypothetical protein SVU88_02335 [Candidatus Nanohaloarchaea archaeon]|nr:hypothetical protein [Candidatus Nanohaloarchaea archaeon]